MVLKAPEIESSIRAALRVCSLIARGLWCEMRYLIDESDRPGHLRQNGRPMSASQLARAAGCDADAVSPLLQELEDSGLLKRSDGDKAHDRFWYSPWLAQLEELRAGGRERVRLCRERQARGEKGVAGRPRGQSAPKMLRNAGCNISVTQPVTKRRRSAPRPSPDLSPETPLFTPTQPPGDSVAAQRPAPAAESGGAEPTAPAAAPAAEAEQTPPANPAAPSGERKKRPGILTDEQIRVRDEFQHWFIWQGYQSTHGGVGYCFRGKRDGPAVMTILRYQPISWNLETAKAVATVFLNSTDQFIRRRGHKLYDLADNIEAFVTKFQQQQQRGSSNGTGSSNGASDAYTLPRSRRVG